jgi:ABC-2 type transport system ATP-binding protein
MIVSAVAAPAAALPLVPPPDRGVAAGDVTGVATVVVDGLVKAYGARRALDDVGFTAGPGVTGILGPNGAGKTTLLRCLAGISGWDSGRIALDGLDAERHGPAARRIVGFMPECFAVPGEMRVEPYLRFVAAAKGIAKAERAVAVEDALARAGLAGIGSRILANLSKGYRQRVGLAQAVLGQPPVVVLDEPTAGLDPLTVLDVRRMLADYGRDRAVLLSTHMLSEARLLCDRLVVLGAGRVVYDGPTAAMAASGPTRDVRFRLAPRPGAIDVDNLASVVDGAGWDVLGVEPTDDALEEAFRAAVLGTVGPSGDGDAS